MLTHIVLGIAVLECYGPLLEFQSSSEQVGRVGFVGNL